jgi:hypothetical protein
MAVKPISDEDVLRAIVELAGDGYCLLPDLLPSLPKPPAGRGSGTRSAHSDRRRAVERAINRGLVIERRGPDGRAYVAVASEGWRLLHTAA